MPFGIENLYRKRRMIANDNPLEDLKGLYEDEGPALSAYKEHLSKLPQREEYGNSTGRKLLAGVVGGLQALREGPGAGIKTTTGILDDRYNDALVDYKNRAAGLQEQAGLEQAQTNSKLKYLIDSQDLIRKDRDLDIKGRNVDSQVDYRNRQAGTAETNARTNEGRAKDYSRFVDIQEEVAPRRVAASERMAGAAERNAGVNEGRERRLRETPPKVKSPTAFAFRDAGNQALLDVIQEHPEFKEFIGEKNTITPPDDESKMESFQLFRQLLEQKKKRRLGSGDIELPDPDEADDYEILEDE